MPLMSATEAEAQRYHDAMSIDEVLNPTPPHLAEELSKAEAGIAACKAATEMIDREIEKVEQAKAAAEKKAAEQDEREDPLRIRGHRDQVRYVLAATRKYPAIFTLHNVEQGTHRTFEVQATKDSREGSEKYFVRILTGPDNSPGSKDYTYLGMIFGAGYRRTAKSALTDQADPFRWFWLVTRSRRHDLPEGVIFRHSGRCARCGARLTNPVSQRIGLGPWCRKQSVVGKRLRPAGERSRAGLSADPGNTWEMSNERRRRLRTSS